MAIARRAFCAPEALSFVSRGLVARSASYPRKRRHIPSFPGGDVPPARDTLRATFPSARLLGVAPAPRLQPPANHRERLRRTPQRAPRVPVTHRPHALLPTITHLHVHRPPTLASGAPPTRSARSLPPTLCAPPADTGHPPLASGAATRAPRVLAQASVEI